MSLFDASELASMREEILLTLPDTCTVLSVTYTADGMGGHTSTWGTVTANVRCRLDGVRGGEQVQGAAVRPYYAYLLTVPYDASLTAANRVIHNGATYAVTSVDADKSWSIVKRAYVERV